MTQSTDAVREALESAYAWLGRWAEHVGDCRRGARCTCGLTAIIAETETALAALPSQGWRPPEGWRLVPEEPTEVMLHAAFVAMNETPSGTWKRMKADGSTPRRLFDVKMAPRYRAMLAKSPAAPATREGGA